MLPLLHASVDFANGAALAPGMELLDLVIRSGEVPFQFVLQTALDQSTEKAFCGLVAVERNVGDVGLAFCPTHRPVHRLDDVAAGPRVAQGQLETWLQRPLRRTDLLAETKAFELGAADP